MGNKGGKEESNGKSPKEKPDKKSDKKVDKKGAKPAPTNTSSGSAAVQKPSAVPIKSSDLTDADYQFLISQTGLPKDDIKTLFDKFMSNNPDSKLDKKEFVQLYTQLRPENDQNLDEISEFVFRAFDSGNRFFLSVNDKLFFFFNKIFIIQIITVI
jgi:hypothetical protein